MKDRRYLFTAWLEEDFAVWKTESAQCKKGIW